MPAEAESASRTKDGVNSPVLTYLLSGLCVLLTVAHQTSGNMPPSSFWYRLGHFGHLPATQIWDGQWPALFTTLFIHGDPSKGWGVTLVHLGFNLLVLIQAGRVLEATLNPLAYYGFFVASAMVGSGAELAASGSTGVGASGVVYAMFGLLWAGRQRDEEWAEVANPLAVKLVVGWAVVCVVLTQLNVLRIANAAHFGGLLFGIGVGWVFIAKRYRPLGSLILAGLATLTVLSLTWMPWSQNWTFWKGTRELRAHRYNEAVRWFERAGRLGANPRDVERNIIVSLLMRDHPQMRGVLSAPDQPDPRFIIRNPRLRER